MNREQNKMLEYLLAENAVLKEQLKKKGRIRFTDDQRRRLATKAKDLGRAALKKFDTIVTPDTLRRWHRLLIAKSTTAARSVVQVDQGSGKSSRS